MQCAQEGATGLVYQFAVSESKRCHREHWREMAYTVCLEIRRAPVSQVTEFDVD